MHKHFKFIHWTTVTNWNARQPVKFMPEDVMPELCTNIIYAYTLIDAETLTIRSSDKWTDIDNAYYQRVTAFREKGINVTVAIGAWHETLGDYYLRYLSTPDTRRTFIESVVKFIETYNFQGLDLDLEVRLPSSFFTASISFSCVYLPTECSLFQLFW